MALRANAPIIGTTTNKNKNKPVTQPQTGSQAKPATQTQATTQSGGYIPLDNSGNDYSALAGMSAADRAALEAAQQGWLSTDDPVKKAGYHSEGEAIRAKYNYSGGMDGSQYLPFAKKEEPSSTRSFSYENAPSYTNKYQDLIEQLTGQIINQEPFSYNAESDPLYQQYRESYTRGGERAMQDTMGQLAARTGGLASSYAGSAAQQTYDGYMSALADKIPELQQLAYSMYQDEGEKQRLNLQMISALEQGDYAKYQDLLAQYNTDRSFSYNQYRDEISDDRYADETAYNRNIYADETEYNRGIYADETEYKRNQERAQQLAAVGDFSGYLALGYSEEEVQRMQAAFFLQHPEMAALNTTAGGTGLDTGSYVGADSMGNTIYYNNGVGRYSDGTIYSVAPYAMAPTGGVSPYVGVGSSGELNYNGGGGDYTPWNKWSDVEAWAGKYGTDSAKSYIKEHYKELGYKNQSTALAGWQNHLTEMGGSIGGGGSNDSGGYSAGTRTQNAQTDTTTPSSEKAITSVSQLGTEAKRILNHINLTPNYVATQAQKGLSDGTITEAEAEYLLRAVGY